MSAVDSGKSKPSRACWAGSGGGSREVSGWEQQWGTKQWQTEVWEAECCQTPPSTAVWKMDCVTWTIQLLGVYPSLFSIVLGSGIGNVSYGSLPHLLLSWGPHVVWEWLPPCLSLEKHVEPAALEWLPSCPCPRGPRGRDLWEVSAVLSLSQ